MSSANTRRRVGVGLITPARRFNPARRTKA